jgi:hypothetical protein
MQQLISVLLCYVIFPFPPFLTLKLLVCYHCTVCAFHLHLYVAAQDITLLFQRLDDYFFLRLFSICSNTSWSVSRVPVAPWKHITSNYDHAARTDALYLRATYTRKDFLSSFMSTLCTKQLHRLKMWSYCFRKPYRLSIRSFTQNLLYAVVLQCLCSLLIIHDEL